MPWFAFSPPESLLLPLCSHLCMQPLAHLLVQKEWLNVSTLSCSFLPKIFQEASIDFPCILIRLSL